MLQNFFIGLLASFIGSLPIGVLNLNAIDIGMKKDMRKVAYFSFGASLVEFFQVGIVILIMIRLMNNTISGFILEVIAVPVFIAFIVYYLKKAKQDKGAISAEKINRNEFTWAVFLSVINPLVFPFWLMYLAYFLSMNWIILSTDTMLIFSLGIFTGTFLSLYLYGYTGKYLASKIPKLAGVMNLIMGTTFIFVAIYQVFHIFTKYPEQFGFLQFSAF